MVRSNGSFRGMNALALGPGLVSISPDRLMIWADMLYDVDTERMTALWNTQQPVNALIFLLE